MKKIMFNDKYGLTDAVLNGRKTQTRRIIKAPKSFKGQDVNGFWVYRRPDTREVVEVCMKDYNDSDIEGGQIRPKYDFDEIVAVAQAYKNFYNDKYNPSLFPAGAGVLNKMFVKPELMPHQIRITDIRVERLQDISDEDCLREGVITIEPRVNGGVKSYYPCEYLKSCADKSGWGIVFDTPKKAFAELIDMVSGKGTWERNPYVFVYEFELVK